MPSEPSTALLEQRGGVKGDAKLVRQAIRNRWPTRPDLREAIATKFGTAAVTGVLERRIGEQIVEEPLTAPAQVACANLYYGMERANQADDHHLDRLNFHERALEARNAGQTSTLAGVRLEQEVSGKASVVVYLPDNGRSSPLDDDLRPEDLLQD